ncbi:MAG: tetratricopeptide repeat protein [Candidatus Aminicenantales bacterium]
MGYAAPAEAYFARIQKALAGVDTFRSLSGLYAKDPKNIEVVFKLAQKYDQKFSTWGKADELYRQIVALDPDGKAGLTDVDYPKARVPYTEYAEFLLGRRAAIGAKADPGPMRAFIQKYEKSPLVKTGYMFMGIYYENYAPKDAAQAFFDEYTGKYPDDLSALGSYVRRIIRDKEPLDKGIRLADKISELTSYNPEPYDIRNRAELLWLEGDKAKAEEIFGKEFLKNQKSGVAYELSSYADFWSEREANLDQAVEAIELAVKLQPDTPYLRQTAATIYRKMNKPEKALEVFGPEYAKKNYDKSDALYPYAWYWNQQGKNLESALEAVRRLIEIQPGLTYFDIQAQILFKLKNYDEALKSAERALALAQESVKRRPGFAIKPYEARVQEIKTAMAKEKGGDIKK